MLHWKTEILSLNLEVVWDGQKMAFKFGWLNLEFKTEEFLPFSFLTNCSYSKHQKYVFTLVHEHRNQRGKIDTGFVTFKLTFTFDNLAPKELRTGHR